MFNDDVSAGGLRIFHMHKPHKLTKKNSYHMMLLQTVVVVDTQELYHRLYVGLRAFRFPMTVYSTTEGLRERYETCEEEHMNA